MAHWDQCVDFASREAYPVVIEFTDVSSLVGRYVCFNFYSTSSQFLDLPKIPRQL